MTEGSVTHWIQEIKHGNRDAAQQLWERYFQNLVRVARKGLNPANRRVSDEEDVAIKVFDTFFRALENGRFPDLSDRDGLWRLLVKMTARKAIDQTRLQLRLRRGGGKLRGESVFHDDAHSIASVVGNEASPEFAAIMGEQISGMLQVLETPDLQQLAIAKMEGYTNKELAEQLDCSERTIERRLKLIRTKINEELLD